MIQRVSKRSGIKGGRCIIAAMTSCRSPAAVSAAAEISLSDVIASANASS